MFCIGNAEESCNADKSSGKPCMTGNDFMFSSCAQNVYHNKYILMDSYAKFYVLVLTKRTWHSTCSCKENHDLFLFVGEAWLVDQGDADTTHTQDANQHIKYPQRTTVSDLHKKFVLNQFKDENGRRFCYFSIPIRNFTNNFHTFAIWELWWNRGWWSSSNYTTWQLIERWQNMMSPCMNDRFNKEISLDVATLALGDLRESQCINAAVRDGSDC